MNGLVEHFFRRDYARLVAMLARRVGVRHIEAVEDAVQSALGSALTAWADKGVPENPTAWLYTAAFNNLLKDLRRPAAPGGEAPEEQSAPAEPFFEAEIRDDLLRMLFVCCDEAIPLESRLVLSLKTLCGFSTAEIALRLFTTEANVHKRLARARERLRESPLEVETPPLETLRSRLPAVQTVLYLLFNEGYLSAYADEAIRRELCEEAVRLTAMLADHSVGAVPETFALLALMHFHLARLGSRVDAAGGLLLLEEQDRSLWDRNRMLLAAEWLQKSATGDVFSRFHAEAGIAAEHCFAPSLKETRWDEIAGLYAMLERIAPSPLHTLNRAVAVAEWQGPAAGLAVLAGLSAPSWLEGSYLWDAVLADLHRRAGDAEIAERLAVRAVEAAPGQAIRELLRRRLSAR